MDPHGFQIRLDSLLLRGYRRACLLLTWFFLGLFLFRAGWFQGRLRLHLMLESLTFGLAFLGLTLLAGRVRPDQRRVELTGMAIVAVATLNALALHLILQDNWQTTNFMVGSVATGLVFRRTLPFVLMELLLWGAWGVGVWLFPPHPMLHWTLGMASSLLVGVAAHLFLVRLLGELERLNTRDHELIQERGRLIQDLRSALDNVKTLHGLIPICAQCKQIRDDQGFWQSVEHYMVSHTDVDFTHSLCPSCIEAARREFFKAPE